MQIAITVKTYPNPSTKYSETVCTAGVDLASHQLVRLYPVRLRDMPYPQWFKKWDIVEADVTHKGNDKRGDTYTPDPDSIRTVGNYHRGKKVDWQRRNDLVLPLASNLEALCEKAAAFEGSIGLVRITRDSEFYMRPDTPEWSPKQLAIMSQESLFESARKPLEKVPWSFHYRFRCADNPNCLGHDMQVFDWEPFELLRGQKKRWNADKAKHDVLHQYNERMGPSARNVHLFVGTTIAHPTQFSCIGIYAPPLND